MSKQLVAFRFHEPVSLLWHGVGWRPLISMLFKNVAGLLQALFMNTKDTLRVAQTGFHAVPPNLLEGAGDDEEVRVLSDDDAEALVQTGVEVPGLFRSDSWNSQISLAILEARAVEPARRP